MIWIFWRTIWSHLKTSDGPLTPLWNPLSFQTLAQYLQAVVQQGPSLVCGAFALPPCLPLITSIWAGSSRHTLLHSISDCWLMGERERREWEAETRQEETDEGEKWFWGGWREDESVVQKVRNWEKQKKVWAENRKHVCNVRKRKDAGVAGMLSRTLLPSVKSQLHSPLNNPPCHPSVPVCLTFFLPPSFLFIAGSPSWIPRPSLEKPCLTFLFFFILLACFVSASQDLSSSPSLERADSGISECQFIVGRPSCRERLGSGTEMDTEN